MVRARECALVRCPDVTPPAVLNTQIWAWLGFDQLGALAGEVKDPSRSFPLGITITAVANGLVYLVPVVVGAAVAGDFGVWDGACRVCAASRDLCVCNAAAVCCLVSCGLRAAHGTRAQLPCAQLMSLLHPCPRHRPHPRCMCGKRARRRLPGEHWPQDIERPGRGRARRRRGLHYGPVQRQPCHLLAAAVGHGRRQRGWTLGCVEGPASGRAHPVAVSCGGVHDGDEASHCRQRAALRLRGLYGSSCATVAHTPQDRPTLTHLCTR